MSRNQQLLRILSNNRSGSSEILDKINKWFLTHRFSKDEYNSILKDLKMDFIEFRNIENYLQLCLRTLKISGIDGVKNLFNEYEEDKKIRGKKLLTNSLKTLSRYNSFITISNSQTLENFFVALSHEKRISVIVCESRPVFEGRIFVKKLNSFNIEISLITEAMMAEAMQNVDAAIIGADKLFHDGSAANKVGSRPLAICAKYYKKPFFVIASNDKLSENNIFSSKKKSNKEIWTEAPKSVKIDNYYFELIEKKLINKIITN